MAGLKLIAMDVQDLDVISAYVQDAISKPDMLDYAPSKKQFSVVMNRFAWDASTGKRTNNYERHGAMLVFAGVTGVKALGIRRNDSEQILSLLTVKFTPAEDMPAGKIDLIFADGAIVQLEVEFIEARLNDMGSAWETKFKPRHPVA